MSTPSLPTEIFAVQSGKPLGSVYLDWMPQPGAGLELNGNFYTVMERRHCYQLKCGRYAIAKIVMYVQLMQQPLEKSLVNGCWVIGDASCKFNAHSEVIRCAVNPIGPCEGCKLREE
jgi:hypothetical protein